jgi:glycosyltransferase involved in cell wall biosynthesis
MNQRTCREESVLVIGMPDSIHLSRWLAQFADSPTKFYIFASSPARRLRPELRELLNRRPDKFKLVGFPIILAAPLWLLDKVLANSIRAFLLGLTLRKFKPTVVHAIELQNAGYILLRASRGIWGPLIPNKRIITNWGSDIFWFRQFPSHLRRIKALLGIATHYSAECQRDVNLARDLGYKGAVLPVFPNSGGLPNHVFEVDLIPPSERSILLVKGYHGWVGRAILALRAIEQTKDQLQHMKIVVYSCNFSTKLAARRLQRRTGLSVKVYGKGELSHTQMLELFRSAKIHVGISLSDAISTAVLESLASGAIPVQSATACVDEWFCSGGVVVEDTQVSEIAKCILKGIQLADEGSDVWRENRESLRAKASRSVVTAGTSEFYSV